MAKRTKRLQTKKYIFAYLFFSLAFICVFLFFRTKPTNISDDAKKQDLTTIESALNKSINEQTADNRVMPPNLKSLNVELNGKLKDYIYKDAQSTYFGGDYTLCTYFKNEGLKNTEEYFTYGGTVAYDYHKKGYSCFRNSVYKDTSHIKPDVST